MHSIPDPAALGAFVNTDDGLLTRHRFAVLSFSVLLVNAAMMTCRVMVPYFKQRYPLPKHSMKDVVITWLGGFAMLALWVGKVDANEPRLEENVVLQHRIKITLATMVFCHCLNHVYMNHVFVSLPEAVRSAQASNAMRGTIKLVLAIYWAGSGDFMRIHSVHPYALTDDLFFSGYLVQICLVAMYMWELLFRDLRPVNIIHHGMCFMGTTSLSEWASAVEPIRTLASIPIFGALTEGVCCLGTMAYRFFPKGALLQRVMLAETVYVLVLFTSLQAYFLYATYAYRALQSNAWLFCNVFLASMTYPAQMNMAYVFWSLSKKAGRKEVVVETTRVATMDMDTVVLKREIVPPVKAASLSATRTHHMHISSASIRRTRQSSPDLDDSINEEEVMA